MVTVLCLVTCFEMLFPIAHLSQPCKLLIAFEVCNDLLLTSGLQKYILKL